MVDNIHVSGTATGVRMLRSLVPTSLLCIASGGGMGPEAPLVQTTGTVASWMATRARLQVRESRVLTIAGMAAGFTVLFGAPLGSAVFALELLHRRGLQYYEALLPAVLGSLAGYGVYVAATGAGLEPVWHLPSPPACTSATSAGPRSPASVGHSSRSPTPTRPPRCGGARAGSRRWRAPCAEGWCSRRSG
jgi:H+/Cl- antiporter ClcA